MRIWLPLLVAALPCLEARADGEGSAAALSRANELVAQREKLAKEGRYAEALALAREILSLRESALGPEHPAVATTLNALAGLLCYTGAYEEARAAYERTLRIREKALGPDATDVAVSLNDLGNLLQSTGHPAEARPYLERALAIHEKSGSPDTEIATTLVNLGSVLQGLGDFGAARPLLERALRIHEETLGPDHEDVALSLDTVGWLLQCEGALAEALPLYERALAIVERSYGPSSPQIAHYLNSLAVLLDDMGEYGRSRPLYERALAIEEKAFGLDHPGLASLLNNLAWLMKTQGSYAEARLLYERALRLKEKALGPESSAVAETLNNLGCLAYAQGAYPDARVLLERALRIREKVLGPDHFEVGRSLSNLGLARQAEGAYDEAKGLYERALRICEKTLGPDHPIVAKCVNNLGWLLWTTGDLEGAKPLYERALRIQEGVLGREHPGIAQMLLNVSEVNAARGALPEALAGYERMLSVTEKSVRSHLAGLSGPERLSLVRTTRYRLDEYLKFAPQVSRSGYEEVLRFKGLVWRAEAAERRLLRRGGAAAADRQEKLRAAENRLARLANSIPGRTRPEARAAWERQYAAAVAERERLAAEMAREAGPLREGLERLDLRLPDIQARLGANEALVDFLRSRGRYLAWIVRATGSADRIDLGPAEEIETACEAFATSIAQGEASGKPGRTLRRLAWDPIEARLGKDVRTVVLCHDAALAAVPFAALPGREANRFWIDDYRFRHVSMAQDLVPWPGAKGSRKGALLVGAVDYGRASAGMTFGTLPGTEAEVAFLATRLGAGSAVVLGSDATEARVREEAPARRILHFATHGFVRDDLMAGLRDRGIEGGAGGADVEARLAQGHDPMLLAALAMAGANARAGGGDDDGILTALEASHLDLDGVDLVTLSACQTARGRAESGEGVLGLVRAFGMAGAERVVGSLWRVDDEATRMLMERFYGAMLREKDPLAPADALREAVIATRAAHGSDGRSFAAPRAWAAFVCYGR